MCAFLLLCLAPPKLNGCVKINFCVCNKKCWRLSNCKWRLNRDGGNTSLLRLSSPSISKGEYSRWSDLKLKRNLPLGGILMIFIGRGQLLQLWRRDVFRKGLKEKNPSNYSLWKCSHHGTSGQLLHPEMRTFLEENTEIVNHGTLTPEISLRLMTPRCQFWHKKAALWPYGEPYWAFYWPGGQGLSRYILDNPNFVRSKKVLDLGSGSGATAIAAMMSGASQVVANDIDPVAAAAMTLNCELNNVKPFPVLTENLIGTQLGSWDLIVLGDMFYSEELADSLHQWLKKYAQAPGTHVLIGDPGRPHFVTHRIQQELHRVREYVLPEATAKENNGSTTTVVWYYRP